MEARQRHKLDALERMLTFVTEEPVPPPLQNAPEGFGEQITALRDAISEAERHAKNQESGHPYQITRHRKRVRDALRYEHLQPLRDIARVIEREIPGLPTLVNLPGRSASERRLISAAQAAMRDILPYRDQFIARGLPSDFLAQLEFAITELVQIKQIRAEAVNKRITASKGISTAIVSGMHAAKCLSAVIKRCCRQDHVDGPSTLHAWEAAARVRRPDRSSQPDDPVQPVEPVQSAQPVEPPAVTDPTSHAPVSHPE